MNANVITLTSEQQALHDALVFLKGIIVGYSVAKGMKYASNRTPSPLFEKGKELGADIATRWNGKDIITAIHVVYNRLRHDRPHTGTVQGDEEALAKAPRWPGKVLKDEFGVEVCNENPRAAFLALTDEKMEVAS